MQTDNFASPTPFDARTGDLLPQFRDAYLQSRLAPAVAQQVEAYLKTRPVQTGVLLGRYHQLAESARGQGYTVVPPLWVQRQLSFQPTSSLAGPLRRPAVRVALALFGALSVASAVQWLRNEPLVPAPVAAAVARVATAATQTTQRLVQRLVAAPSFDAMPARLPLRLPAESLPAAKAAPRRPALPAPVAAQPAVPEAARPPAPADSVARVPAALPAPAAAVGVVRGHISDALGNTLTGATVLVKGTDRGTSTDAAGDYALEVPAGATLLFGYAGCADVLRSASLGTMNIVLKRNPPGTERPNRRR